MRYDIQTEILYLIQSPNLTKRLKDSYMTLCDNTDYEVFNELSEGLWKFAFALKFKASITILLIFREGNFP